jgi:O-antigen ligase
MQTKTLKKIIYFLLALAPFTLFIVANGKFLNLWQMNSSGLFFPFISGKNMLFRLIVEAAFVTWLILIYKDKDFGIKKNWLTFSVIAFTVILFIADLFGVNRASSFFSGFERMEGFVGHVHYLLYFIVLSSVVKTKEEWAWLAKWFIIAGVLVSLVATFQLLGSKDFIVNKQFPVFSGGCQRAELPQSDCLLWENRSEEGGVYWKGMSNYFPISQGGRVDGTLGNPAYFAILAVYMVLLSLLGIVYTKKFSVKVLLVLFTVLNAVLLIYASTRSATLGLFVGLVSAGAIYLFDKKKFKYEWIALGISALLFAYSVFFRRDLTLDVFLLILAVTAVAVVKSFVVNEGKAKKVVALLFLAGIALVTIFTLARESNFVKSNIFLNRFTTISVTDATGNSRIMVWKMAIEGLKEKPLLGWGQDNFSYVFAKHHNPGMYAQEPWFDRSHNVFFDWLIAAGIIGLLGHLALYLFAAILTHRAKLFSFAEKSIIYGMLIAQFINNLFIFDNLASYMLFYAMLAYIAAIYVKGEAQQKDIPLEKYKEWFVPVGILLTAVLSISSVIFPYFANKAAIEGLSYQEASIIDSFAGRRNGFETALATGLVGQREIKEQLVSMSYNIFGIDEKNLSSGDASRLLEEKRKWFNLVTGIAKEDIASYPDDLRVLELYGNFYLRIGDMGLAEKLLTEAHALAPKRQRTYFLLIQLYLMNGVNDKAFVLAKETYELAPAYELARKTYALLALRKGEKEFESAVTQIRADGQKMVYPLSLADDLVGITDKKVSTLFVSALKKDYVASSTEIDAEYKKLLLKK